MKWNLNLACSYGDPSNVFTLFDKSAQKTIAFISHEKVFEVENNATSYNINLWQNYMASYKKAFALQCVNNKLGRFCRKNISDGWLPPSKN